MEKADVTNIADSGFLKSIQSSMSVNANHCYQCKKCSAGCPVVYEMDFAPHQIIHAVRLGMKDLVLKSRSIWLCVSCETCTTRCPHEVDIVKIMDAARIFAKMGKVTPAIAISEIPAFHRSALQIIKIFGRMYELGVVMLFKLRTKEFRKDIDFGLRLIKIGKLTFLPDLTTILKIHKLFSKALKMEGNGK